MWPWDRYQKRKLIRKKLEELKKQEPFIYE